MNASQTYLLLSLLALILAALSVIGVSLHRLLRRSDPSRLRAMLPMSSGVPVKSGISAQIKAQPQRSALRPERIVIGGTPGNWIVNDVKVMGRSQFAQSGDVPGEMFSSGAIDCFLRMEVIEPGMSFEIVVTHVGPEKDGQPFVCAVIGTEVTAREARRARARTNTIERESSLRDLRARIAA